MTNDFQSLAGDQGRNFEALVEFMLKASGWTITGHHVVVEGAEIDLVGTDPAGVEWWVECKGSWRGRTPGSKRGDTVKKAVGVAAYLATLPPAVRRPYRLVTSHLPNDGTLSARMLRAAQAQGWFAAIDVVGFTGMAAEEPDD